MSWHVRIQMQLGTLALDVDLEQPQDNAIALIGPNGSGKTTLLRTIAGAHRPSAGRIRIGDRVCFDTASAIDFPPETRQVGYVPQGYGLFPHLNVLDNVAFGLTSRRPPVGRLERHRAGVAILEQLGCADLALRTPKTLSGGEQQRVALARALMIRPRILLLDEPLAALDAAARRSLRGYLAHHLANRGGPAIVITHDLRDVLALGADVVVLDAGQVVQRGTAQTLAESPRTDFVAEFFDAPLRARKPV